MTELAQWADSVKNKGFLSVTLANIANFPLTFSKQNFVSTKKICKLSLHKTFKFGQNVFVGPKKKIQNHQNGKKTKIVSSHGNMRRTQFDQKSPRPPEEGVSQRHRQTNRQTNIATI